VSGRYRHFSKEEYAWYEGVYAWLAWVATGNTDLLLDFIRRRAPSTRVADEVIAQFNNLRRPQELKRLRGKPPLPARDKPILQATRIVCHLIQAWKTEHGKAKIPDKKRDEFIDFVLGLEAEFKGSRSPLLGDVVEVESVINELRRSKKPRRRLRRPH
jgi:hypothetical protein